MHAEQRTQARRIVLALFRLFGIGLERRGFLQLHAHVQAEQAQRAGDQERHAPAPVVHLRIAQRKVQRGHRGGAGDIAAQRAELQPAAHEAAVAVGGVLGDEGRRAAVFAAGGKALHQPRHQQQDRRPDADARVGGDEADRKRAQRHQDHGRGQHLLPAVAVAQRAEHQPAQRAHQERHGEGRERGDQLRGRVGAGKEHVAQGHGQVAVHAEVEPFHRVAQRRRADRPLEHGFVDDGDFFHLQLAAALEPSEMGVELRHVFSCPGTVR
ncbi:hypothetical protein NB689_003087 [Xanthomonas sacchari]|nr:hypothetical protein [Xanthomonas sacchari]